MPRTIGWPLACLLGLGALLAAPAALGDGNADPGPREEQCEKCGAEPCVCDQCPRCGANPCVCRCAICGAAGAPHGLRDPCHNYPGKYTCQDCDCCLCTEHDWEEKGEITQSHKKATILIGGRPEKGKSHHAIGPGTWSLTATVEDRPVLVHAPGAFEPLGLVDGSDEDEYEWSERTCECADHRDELFAPCRDPAMTWNTPSITYHIRHPGSKTLTVTYSRKEQFKFKPIIHCKTDGCTAIKDDEPDEVVDNDYGAELKDGGVNLIAMKVKLNAPSADANTPASLGAGAVASEKHWLDVAVSLTPSPDADYEHTVSVSRADGNNTAFFMKPHDGNAYEGLDIPLTGGVMPVCPDADNPGHDGKTCGYRLVSSSRIGAGSVTAGSGAAGETAPVYFAWPVDQAWSTPETIEGNRLAEIKVGIGLDQHELEFNLVSASGYRWNAAENRYDAFTTTNPAELSSCAVFTRDELNVGGDRLVTDGGGGVTTYLKPTVTRDLVVTQVGYRVRDRRVTLP